MRRPVKGMHTGFASVLWLASVVVGIPRIFADSAQQPSASKGKFCGLDILVKKNQLESYNLTSLQTWSPWPYSFERQGNSPVRQLELNICRAPAPDTVPTGDPCRNSSVCEIVGDKRTSFSGVKNVLDHEISYIQGVMLYYQGPLCPGSSTNKLITVHLSCGRHLGNPRLILDSECFSTFEWFTSAACSSPPKRAEVPCYSYDSQGRLYDLTSLIKSRGSYQVQTLSQDESFFINVCSEIVSDDFPAGSAAVFQKKDERFSAGQLKSRISFVDGVLKLVYETTENEKKIPGCSANATTIVTFRCPKQGSAKLPILISSTDCFYEVEWETEHACPLTSLKGNFSSCSFNQKQHGVNIDLSPLRKKPGAAPYSVPGEVNNVTYNFLMNVCGGISKMEICSPNWKSSSVCLIRNDTQKGTVLAKTSNSKLKYVDGEVTLTYDGFRNCPTDVHITSSVVINFVCNETADEDGIGRPTFQYEEECMFFFDWPTKYACVKQASCRFSHGTSQFNLASVSAATNQRVWEVVDSLSRNGRSREMYMSLCGDQSLLASNRNCPDGSLICLKDGGQFRNYGSEMAEPKFNEETTKVEVSYVNGEECTGGKKMSTKLTIACSPGQITRSPVLLHLSDCEAELEWSSAVGCPIRANAGSNCKVFDENLGLVIDLSPLKSVSGYNMTLNGHLYYINVCGPVSVPGCPAGAGGCQMEAQDGSEKRSWSLGKSTSNLTYRDSFVSLVYVGGTPYRDTNRTPRSMTIAFLCDLEAGAGAPVFEGEADRAYSFRWETSYACPKEVSVGCMVEDPSTQRQYDLSSLTRANGNWEVMDSDGKRKFYLNVCRPVNQVPACKKQSAACYHTLERGKVIATTNLGQSFVKPQISSDGHLQLKYDYGDACMAYGEKTNYSVSINFVCHKGSSTEGPRFLGVLGSCQFSFLWSTQAACSIGDESKKECFFQDPVTGNIVDLKPLRKDTFYETESNGRKFQLNICGPVGAGACPRPASIHDPVSACELTTDGKNLKTVLGFAGTSMLHVAGNSPIRLKYFGEFNSTQDLKNKITFTNSEIRFQCLYSGNRLRFLRQENHTYIFEFGTPLVCVPDPVDCDIVDAHGLEYNLNALVNNGTSDWVAKQYKAEKLVSQFHVSFCKPLTGMGGIPCHGAGICKSDSGTTFMSLGKQQLPRVTSDGTITIEYKDGSQCARNRKINYSALVQLHCSPVRQELEFLGESPECNYVFHLQTPAACPIKVFKGQNCLVTDPMYGITFDLSPLRKDVNNYKVQVGEYTYLLNVCGALNDPISGCYGSAICQTKERDPSFVVSTGKPSSELTLRDGLIQLQYPDGKPNCHRDYNRSTILTFVCDETTDGVNEGPSFISEEKDCTYVFQWPTRYACPPHVVSNCNVKDDKGSLYDLSGLASHLDNYVVINPYARSQKFLLNVCRSLVRTPDQQCGYGSAACLVNDNSRKPDAKSLSIGNVLRPPLIEDGQLRLRYIMGDICPTNNSIYLQSVITFQCDPYAHRGVPEVTDYGSCVYNFLWRTALACAIEEKRTSIGYCTAINPATGYLFNLSSLSSKTSHVVESDDSTFLVNVCSELQDPSCTKGTGACQTKHHNQDSSINYGLASSDLFYHRGSLFLNYSSGDACEERTGTRSTFVTFECSRVDSGPIFLSNPGDCTVFINWNTPLACENIDSDEVQEDANRIQVPCIVYTDNGTIDLSPLIQHETAFNTLDVNKHIGIYGINVCKSLTSFGEMGLEHPAAVCSLCFSQTKPVSLGTLNKPPYMDSTGQIVIDYVNGSKCSFNESKRFSSKVIFICENSDEDTLEVIDVDEDSCTVIFELRTPVLCMSPQLPSLCSFSDRRNGYMMELNTLHNNGLPFQVRDGKDTYDIGICSVVRSEGPCKGAGVCRTNAEKLETSLGLVGKTSFFHNGVHLSMVYYTEDDCPIDGIDKKQSEIKFYCNPSNGIGKPQFYKSSECLTVFLWPTEAVCHLDHPPCTLYSNNHLFDLRELSSISHSWPARYLNDTYWLNICREVHPGILKASHDTTCPTYSSVCKVDEDKKTFMLGNILTQKLSYNEKSKVLYLTYDHGDPSLCAPSPSRDTKEPIKATTEIQFTCGNTIGSPKFVSGPDDRCVFRFNWKSIAACPESNETRIAEVNGILVDKRLEAYDFYLNLSEILNTTFSAQEIFRNEDNFSYAINIKRGVGPKVDHPECTDAAVCQFKPDGSFYRDIGTIGTAKFYLKGNGLRLVLTSHGRKCGKNKNKNVTSIIKLQCSSADGLGTPVFEYENNNCDYIFKWDTTAVCPRSTKSRGFFGGVHVLGPVGSAESSSMVLSVPAILGIVMVLLASVILVLIFLKKDRRVYLKTKVKSCFHNIHWPCYRYQDFQCYFLKGNGSLSSQMDGEAVLLAPHETLPKFQDDSDSDPIA